jgi:ring-1,2-phenylacetyl-CoA epoxidase subunit PaaE
MCGPAEHVTTARDLLIEHGVDTDRIHLELFFGYSKASAPIRDYPTASLSFQLAGAEYDTTLGSGETVLEAALQVRGDAPYACLGGACGTCKARLLSGTVEMDQNFALGPADVDAGYILTCQSRPTSSEVSVDYDG